MLQRTVHHLRHYYNHQDLKCETNRILQRNVGKKLLQRLSKFSSTTNGDDKTKQLMNELSTLGYKDEIAKGMLEAIAQCYNKKVSSLDVSSLEMFGKEGKSELIFNTR